jgi:hypothetical protein
MQLVRLSNNPLYIHKAACHKACAAESVLLVFSVKLDNQYGYMAY